LTIGKGKGGDRGVKQDLAAVVRHCLGRER
jgi:hypothetical protein